MKDIRVIIAIILMVGVFASIGMYYYQKNQEEKQKALLKQKQLETLSAAGVNIEMGVDWGSVFTGLGGLAGGVGGIIAASSEA